MEERCDLGESKCAVIRGDECAAMVATGRSFRHVQTAAATQDPSTHARHAQGVDMQRESGAIWGCECAAIAWGGCAIWAAMGLDIGVGSRGKI